MLCTHPFPGLPNELDPVGGLLPPFGAREGATLAKASWCVQRSCLRHAATEMGAVSPAGLRQEGGAAQTEIDTTLS